MLGASPLNARGHRRRAVVRLRLDAVGIVARFESVTDIGDGEMPRPVF